MTVQYAPVAGFKLHSGTAPSMASIASVDTAVKEYLTAHGRADQEYNGTISMGSVALIALIQCTNETGFEHCTILITSYG